MSPLRRARGPRALLGALSLLCLIAAAAPAAFAQSPEGDAAEGETADESRSQAFQAVEGAIEEDVPGGPLLVAAYGIIWLAVFGYAFRLVGLQKRTLEELEALRREIAAAGGTGGARDDAAEE